MVPTLADGDFVLMASDGISPSVGQVIVAAHPDPDRPLLLVKRVESVTNTGALIVRSDNPNEGTDSRIFGPLEPGSVLGVVTLHLNSLRRM